MGKNMKEISRLPSPVNYRSHKALKGLGHLGAKKDARGVLMHSALAVTPGRTPLGILKAIIWARSLDEFGKSEKRKERPIEEKESYRWIQVLKSTGEILKDVGQVILTGDRESDIYDLFIEPRRDNFEILIRVAQDRCVKNGLEESKENEPKSGRLFSMMEDAPVLGTYELKIPRRKNQKARKAKIEVRAMQVSVMPPKNRKDLKGTDPVKMYCVFAREINPPSHVKDPVDWKLLTTMPVENFKKAMFCIKGYSNRWVIEEYHKVIKSGCKIEKMQFSTLERMYPGMGICCMTGWRILFLSKYAREDPDGDAELVSTHIERKVLSAFLHLKKHKKWRIKTINDFVVGRSQAWRLSRQEKRRPSRHENPLARPPTP